MFFGIAQPHQGEFRSGLYFESYQEVGSRDRGIFFRYKEQQKTSSMEDIVNNLAHDKIQKVIESTYDLPWKSEAYVLLGDEMWRIVSCTNQPVNEQANAIVKVAQRRHTVTIRRVANATGMQR